MGNCIGPTTKEKAKMAIMERELRKLRAREEERKIEAEELAKEDEGKIIPDMGFEVDDMDGDYDPAKVKESQLKVVKMDEMMQQRKA